MNQLNSGFKELVNSCIVAGLIAIIISTSFGPVVVKPLMLDGSLIGSGRYMITYDGYETVSENNGISVVGIGSSVLMEAMDGECMEKESKIDDIRFYNFAMDGSYPYTEMVQIPALIEASPSVVLIEIGPNSLWGWEDNLWVGGANYNEFRFQLISMTMKPKHMGEWYDILEDKDKSYIDYNATERVDAWSEYSRLAIEEYLKREIYYFRDMLNQTSINYVPEIGSKEWDLYLSQPHFRESKIDKMSDDEIKEYLDEVMPIKSKQGVFNPKSNGTQNHRALNYMINSLVNASIDVVLIGVPHHPWVNDYLENGQLDGMNETYNYFSSFENVTALQMYWDDWPSEAFSDRNHLDSEGRDIFCNQVTPVVDNIILGGY